MKTPDEIKKGLYSCPEELCHMCPYEPEDDCMSECMEDAWAYINQLEQRLEQAERERDELEEECRSCGTCKFLELPFTEHPCNRCVELGKRRMWQWPEV